MIELIKACPLFHDLYDKEVEGIIASCLVAKFAAGQAVFKENDEGQDFFVVLSGTCAVTRDTDQRTVTLSHIKRGEVFGESVLINETRRSANIIAETDCDILVVTHETVFDIYRKKPKVFAILILNLARMLAHRLHASNALISELHKKIAAGAS